MTNRVIKVLNLLCILLWKNWLLQKRKIVLTCFEIGLPTALAFLLLITKQQTDYEVKAATYWEPYNAQELLLQYRSSFPNKVILFSPNTTVLNQVMSNVGLLLNSQVLGLENEDALESYYLGNESSSRAEEGVFYGGIVFSTVINNALPDKISYKIRTKDRFFPETQYPRAGRFRMGPWYPWSKHGSYDYYITGGILMVQNAIDKSLIQHINSTSNFDQINVNLQRMPYPSYVDDIFILIIMSSLPLFLMFSYMVLVVNIVKEVVTEKERKLKESMKLMGVSNWLHWTAWFIKYLTFFTITSALITLFFKLNLGIGAVINKTDGTLLFFVFMLYSCSTILFAFAITTFFSKANVGAAAAGILHFLTYIPYMVIANSSHDYAMGQKMAWCLLPNFAMAMSLNLISSGEAAGIGIQWSYMADRVNMDDDLTLAHVLLMYFVNCVLLALLTWYVDQVHPGEYGMPKPFYFPFTKWYWCGGVRGTESVIEDGTISNEYMEPVTSTANVGIKIRNLRKVFSQSGVKKVAVDDLSLDILNNQITALLGHNGAGKTTTMFMLTGFIPATKGTAIVNGYNINTDIELVRESLGLCPQHNVLFDSMTVAEHLEFFARVKGCPRSQIKTEVESMIAVLRLQNKANAFSSELSGGMKRKLSVGIALIAGSKIVVLDEPTSGMDPEARRHTWDILKSQRSGRTILLTTHFMDEADYLGDRIAIMAAGNLVCSGSSLFLKRKYGVGYHMSMVKDKKCDTKHVDSVIKKHIETARLESDISAELSYVLPRDYSHKFEPLFTELEMNKNELGIQSFGASVTTMEEVFLKVGEESGTENKLKNPGPEAENTVYGIEYDRNTGVQLYIQQFYAMLMKRIIYSKRSYLVSVVQLVIPVLFAFVACIPIIVDKTSPDDTLEPISAKSIGFQYFVEPKVPYSVNQDVAANAQNDVQAFIAALENKATVQDIQAQSNNITALEAYLANLGEDDLRSYIRTYIVAGYFDINQTMHMYHLFYQGEALHAPCLAMNVLGNTLLQYFTGNPAYDIDVTIHPLPLLPEDLESSETFIDQLAPAMVFSTLNFGISFLLATFVVFVIRERNVKAKHCQFISGVHTWNFWMSAFTWDLINYIIPVLGVLIVYAAFGIDGYSNKLQYVFLMLLMYGVCGIPFIYVLSFLFSHPASGFAWLSIFNIFTGIILAILISVLKMIESTESFGNGLSWIAYFTLPNYCLSIAVGDLYSCYTDPECENYLKWDGNGIGKEICFMFIQCIGYFIVLFCIETSAPMIIKRKILAVFSPTSATPKTVGPMRSMSIRSHHVDEDEDVYEEQQRVKEMNIYNTDEPLILSKIKKYYGSFLAVDELSVGIKKGECFGLLGVNGAGKTSTFKMLTGDELISGGEAYVDGFNVNNNIKMVQQRVGYCPQFDALIDKLTVSETLYMYARLRGVKENKIEDVVNNIITNLLLDEFKNKCSGSLSGGNKRKLSTGMALIGDPPIVFLDEPTTGMDPVARRHLWNTLTQIQRAGRTIVLTSHSMEECEALCTRISIMVNGQFKCIGSCQHLKSKFGEGYTLMAKVTAAETDEETDRRMEALMDFIVQQFQGCTLKDMHTGLVMYQISDKDLSWARIFGTMERAKLEYDIEDYSVSQTTLEQVFINFARTQQEPVEESKLKWCKMCCGCCGSKNANEAEKQNRSELV